MVARAARHVSDHSLALLQQRLCALTVVCLYSQSKDSMLLSPTILLVLDIDHVSKSSATKGSKRLPSRRRHSDCRHVEAFALCLVRWL